MIQAQLNSRHRDTAHTRARYDQYVANYSADLYRYGYWLCRDRDSTARLVMKTYQQAWLIIAHSGEASLSKAWFFAALHKEFYGEGATDQSPTNSNAPIAAVKATANYHINWVDSLRNAIGKISVEYRETLILHELFDFSCAEIGRICDVSESAVLTRLLHAKQKVLSDLGYNNARDESAWRNAFQ